ncbi:MAG TPA: DUF4412 domain-containing protein [Abditibacteriaceae bacterium]
MAIAATCVMSAGAAHSDVKYTQTMRMPGVTGATTASAGAPLNSTTTWIKKSAQRVEMSQQIGAYKWQEVTLTLCEKRQSIRLDEALKIYTVSSLDGSSSTTVSAGAKAAPAKASNAKPTTGKVTMTVSVKGLGEETVAGRKARHYMISTRYQTSGCAGNGDNSSKMEIWVTDYQLPDFNCGDKPGDWRSYVHASDSCSVTSEQKGDIAAWQAAYKGLIVKMKIYDEAGTKEVMTQEMTALSEAKLDDALFTVPAGFKQLSAKEYDDARQQAMTKVMQASMGGATNAGASKSGASQSGASRASTTNADDDDTPVQTADDSDNNAGASDDSAAEQVVKDAVKEKVTRKKRRFGLPF